MRRSTVLSLPLQLVFPGAAYVFFNIEKNDFPHALHFLISPLSDVNAFNGNSGKV